MMEVGKGWLLSSIIKLEAKIKVKSFTLSDNDEMISGPFIVTDTFLLSRAVLFGN